MNRQTLDIVINQKIEEAELQMALQCAPVIAGLKIANLLIVPDNHFAKVWRMLNGSDISWSILLRTKEKNHKGQDGTPEKLILLLYHEESLEKYLSSREVREILKKAGYRNLELAKVLKEFSRRYERYMASKEDFPHEMGLLLGYPIEDVMGFIKYKGENALCGGYWKVYGHKERKLRLFQSFELAEERMIQLLSKGIGMADIIRLSRDRWEKSFI